MQCINYSFLSSFIYLQLSVLQCVSHLDINLESVDTEMTKTYKQRNLRINSFTFKPGALRQTFPEYSQPINSTLFSLIHLCILLEIFLFPVLCIEAEVP